MIPLVIYWIAIVISVLVSLFLSFTLVLWLRTQTSKYHAATTVTGLAITVTFLLLFMIPVDVFSVSYMKDNEGNLREWAVNPQTRKNIHDLIERFYYAMFFIISIFLFAILPFFYFLYDETSQVNENQTKRWKTAFLYTPIILAVLVFILLAGAFIPIDKKDKNATTTVITPTTVTPGNTTVTPGNTTVTPSNTTVTPGNTTVTPGNTTVTPGNATVTPSNTTVTPSNTTVTPSNTTVTPGNTTVTPSNTTVTPSNTTVTPSNTTVTPGNTTVTPSNTTVTPGNTTVTPGNTTATTGNTTAVPDTTTTAAPSTTTTAESTPITTTSTHSTTTVVHSMSSDLPVTSGFKSHIGSFMSKYMTTGNEDDESKEADEKDILSKLHSSIGYAYSIIVLCGIFTTCFYTAHGMTLIPLRLMGCRCKGGYESIENEGGKSFGPNFIRSIFGQAKTPDDSEDDELERRSCWDRFKCVMYPIRIVIAIFNMLVSLILLISLTIVCIDKWKNSNYYHGYNVQKFTLFNPADYVITKLQKFFPLDYILFLMMLGSLITASLYSLKVVGVRFLFIKLYRVRSGRTVPQAMVFFAMYSLLMVFSFGQILYTILPTYISYGHQVYKVGDKVMNCAEHVAGDECITTSLSDFIRLFTIKVPFFGAVTFYALNFFVICYVIGIFVSLYRVCFTKAPPVDIVSENSDDVSLDVSQE